jgi:hypothetical protein
VKSGKATTQDRQPRLGSSRLLATAGLILGLLVYLSFSTSAAVFSDSETLAANTFSTGTVELVDDDTGAAMFAVTGIYPGQTVERCIVVTHQGTIADVGQVRVYTGGLGDTTGGNLASNLLLSIDEGTGGSFAAGDCTGFSSTASILSSTDLSTFNSTYTTHNTGTGSWDPTSTPDSRTYRVQVTLSGSAPSSVQGGTVTFGLVWETLA